ncbi:MAG TPA: DUF3052 domain-containing protein [Devosia sp.]|nr:DUF3052 domain-containing protein [Devosia sp.]
MSLSPDPAGSSGTPLPKKLGYRDGDRVLFLALPAELAALRGVRAFAAIEESDWAGLLPEGPGFDVVHGFATRRAELEGGAMALRRRVAPAGMVWISWPKQASKVPTDLTDNVIREVLLPTGLVDVKVAALDAVWSGLKLMIRRELR